MVKRTLIVWLLTCVFCSGFCQKDSTLPQKNSRRVVTVAVANAVFWTGSYIALDKAWYAGYPRSSFHFFNDNSEWNQMDKAGHAWTSYTISRLSATTWRWTGLSNNASAVLGAAGGLAYQSIIELQDAYSSEWGFSWGDMGANAIGAGLFAGQQLAWKEQRIQIKLSYSPYNYPSALLQRRNNLFGSSLAERLLKDYNSQTYWASANLSSFFPDSRLPRWLNVSFGYGSDGMLGARSNKWTDKEGNDHDYTFINRRRRFYISPDLDLTRIAVKSRFLRTTFFILNMIKIPAPAIELSSGGKFSGHALKF